MQDINSVLNNRYLIIFFSLCGLYLSACSTTSSDVTFSPVAAETDKAAVYIYRPTEMANALYSPGLNINDEFKLYAKNGISSRLSLLPGETIFEFQAEKKYSELTPLSLNLKAGETYFIRVNTSLKVKSSTAYEAYARSFKLTRVDQKQAIKEIAECCTDNKKSTDEDEEKHTEKKTPDGFSVDKTQNPFSH